MNMYNKSDKNLFPEKRVSSIGFILNEDKNILLVKPSYYPYWHLPGGYVDQYESPLQAVSREIKEEISLDLNPKKLMMVNYESGNESKKEVIVFIFDFDVIIKTKFEFLKVDNSEIIDYGFFTMNEAMGKVGPDRSKRLELCFKANQQKKFYYLNDEFPLPEY